MALFHHILLITSLCQGAPMKRPLPPQESVRRQVRAMGTLLTIDLQAASRAQALTASEAVISALEVTEQQLSTWRPDSELSRLSKAPIGEAQQLSPEVGAILKRAFFWSRESEGAFDPSLAALVKAWDLRGQGRRPSPAELEQARSRCGLIHFESELPRSLTRLLEGAGLEEGGFGKGAALDAAARALSQLGITSATLDLGGQVLLLPASTPQTFAVAHPDRRQQALAQLTLRSGSIATSGNSERGLEVEGKRIGHLLDPRTGQPAPDFGSVSVWCEQAIDADCLSTALFVLGPERGLRFAADHSGVEALFLIRGEHGLRLRATDGLRSQLTSLDPQVAIEWFTPTPAQRGAPRRQGYFR